LTSDAYFQSILRALRRYTVSPVSLKLSLTTVNSFHSKRSLSARHFVLRGHLAHKVRGGIFQVSAW